MIWVVTANTNMCRIYQFDRRSEEIALLKEINHPENKLKKGDYLTSDRPGHYQTDSSARGAYSPHSDPKEVVIDVFSREIAIELNKGRNSHAYKNLIIITPPHMNGLLSKHLDTHVKYLIESEIQKDVMSLSQHELLIFLQMKT